MKEITIGGGKVTELDLWLSNKAKTAKPKCYTTHEEFELGGGFVLGASCIRPRPGYDIYAGFDRSMHFNHREAYPWEQAGDVPIEFLYRITDGCAPRSPKEFRVMIHWFADRLAEGKNLHLGCIGGHGRTGLVLAALIRVVDDDKHAAEWVRENYCKRAIESQSQVGFLKRHFQINPVEPSKFPITRKRN